MNGVTTAPLSLVVTRRKWFLCENAESRSGTERPRAPLLRARLRPVAASRRGTAHSTNCRRG